MLIVASFPPDAGNLDGRIGKWSVKDTTEEWNKQRKTFKIMSILLRQLCASLVIIVLINGAQVCYILHHMIRFITFFKYYLKLNVLIFKYCILLHYKLCFSRPNA